MVDIVIHELEAYGKALREEDRKIYVELLKLPLKKIGAISYASSIHVWAFLLLSILVEQEKKYERMAHGCVPERELSCTVDKDTRAGLQD
jgi:hypothetical protein